MFSKSHMSLIFLITSMSYEKEHVPKRHHLRQQPYMLCVGKNKINIIYS
jgi:hypothetical protein